MIEPPTFPTRADAVADQIRRAILQGDYPAGTRLIQADMARLLGVSTTPVREALLVLVREGFLTGDPYKGMTVREPNADEMGELYEIRIALEPVAAGRAAERITDAQLQELDGLLQSMRELARGDDTTAEEQHAALNKEFHRRIYEIAQRPRLSELIMSLRAQSDIYIRLFPVKFVSIGTSDEQHGRIVEALRARSASEANLAIRDHLEFNAAHIAGQLAGARRSAS